MSAGLAPANASERNTADGRFSSCPKGVAQIRQYDVAVLGKGKAMAGGLRHKRVVALSNIPERTLKRRFKAATGATLIEYLQNLRVEEAKRLLETGQMPVDEISVEVSHDDPSFFRRLFKRRTGLTPSQYRRMFQPVVRASEWN